MKTNGTDIFVYAHWLGMHSPKYIGLLTARQSKGRIVFGFQYDPQWINSKELFMLDPEIGWFSGYQHPSGKDIFGIFSDSMPDTWGRTLMRRRFSFKKTEEIVKAGKLNDIDFLLGVYDECRMGALRFKRDPEGPFLDNDTAFPIPPLSFLRELQHGVKTLEADSDSRDTKKWLEILVAPGSSLGGARPKANVYDEKQNLWIAKFPSKNDPIDKAVWEYLAYKLAIKAGIIMSDTRILKVSGKHHTFLTKRFDRENGNRRHFASAMTMSGKNENMIKDEMPSYLELAEFIQFNGCKVESDLHQLWRRIVFNIAVSNTDDHLRNHGFVVKNGGWRLSPAFDINPSIDKNGLSMNIDMDNNSLDFELAKSVGKFFQLNTIEMKKIIDEVKSSVSGWKSMASELGISKAERRIMEPAFRF